MQNTKILKILDRMNEFPDWFNEKAELGLVKINYNDEGGIENIIVFSPTKTMTAKVGDIIMCLKSGLTVIDEEKAKRYRVIGNGKEEK